MSGARTTFRLLRALWRYRGQIAAHGDQYQAELATTVRSALDANLAGRTALVGYRVAMRTMFLVAIGLVVAALLFGTLLWQLEPAVSLVALLLLVPAGMLAWWRLAWGRPLDWLTEHNDPTRTVSLAELPTRLHELAKETRSMADVPARVADELDALAREAEA